MMDILLVKSKTKGKCSISAHRDPPCPRHPVISAVLYLFNIVSTLSRAWILSMWRGVGSRKLCAEGIQGRWREKFVSEVARRAGATQAGRRKKGEDVEEGEEEEGEEEKKHKREQVCRRERQERDETKRRHERRKKICELIRRH